MDITATNLVTADNGPRPAGKPDRCFYCGEPIGSEHKADCPCRKKVVMVKATLEIPVAVPQSWDSSFVNFRYNESSWCADNIVDVIDAYLSACEESGRCMCCNPSDLKVEHLRDATTKDLDGVDPLKLVF